MGAATSFCKSSSTVSSGNVPTADLGWFWHLVQISGGKPVSVPFQRLLTKEQDGIEVVDVFKNLHLNLPPTPTNRQQIQRIADFVRVDSDAYSMTKQPPMRQMISDGEKRSIIRGRAGHESDAEAVEELNED
ncbi:hypothetical protein quinque_008434 [Culex quinquefasciatus]